MKKILTLKKVFLLLVTLSIALASCKKDGTDGATPIKTDNLTGVTWVSNKIEYQQPDGSWVEQHDDDFHFAFSFNSDNTFSVTQSSSTGPFNPKRGTWTLIKNNTQIHLMGNSYEDVCTINQLTATTLQWTIAPSAFFGRSAVRETFAKK